MNQPPPLGLIEGFYGRPWLWSERARTVRLLAGDGFSFHIHAPKAAAWLRRGWRDPAPAQELAAACEHAALCRGLGVAFGLGLSPHEFDASPKSNDWRLLHARLDTMRAAGATMLALLFDDIRGDDPGLASRQLRIIDACRDHGGFDELWVCPTYYSDDPVLDRVFGRRPADYLPRLAGELPQEIGLFWTGPEVCSREISPAHLRAVNTLLQRSPVLWDNYPVNDGARMCKALHLRAFSGRPAHNAPWLRAHAINPALQPTLTCIPALTLAERYRVGEDAWRPELAFIRACTKILGESLGAQLRADLIALQDTGRDRLGETAATLRERYEREPHNGAREIIAWLDGCYEITDEIVRTQ
ncbi:MAG: beta-N-acetylglucosaminidase domain-containing protein [Burkholderiaceae bacterium]